MGFQPTYLIDDLTGGINTKQRASKIKKNQLVSILGFDFDANSLRRAKGYTKLGEEADVADTGKSIYNHLILSGIEVLIKTIGTTIKMLDTVDDTWYEITTGTFTANLRWRFITFNGYLYGNNGIDSWIFWNGGTLTTIVNAITAVSTTIDLQPGKGALYPNSGTVMIQGEAITYTGKSTDQLTGCTITQSHAAGSSVVLAVDHTTYSSVEKVRDMAFHQNRIYCISYDNPRKMFHSKLADNTNPETDLINFTVAGSGSGDAGFNFAPNELISVKQYVNGNASAVVATFCKNGVVYSFLVSDGASTTTNAFIALRTMNSFPRQTHLVEVMENDLAFVDQYGHVRTLSYGDVATPLNVQTISAPIEPSLEATDFDDGCIKYHNRKLRVGGAGSEDGINDIYYIHDSNYNSWGANGHWDCVAFEVYNNQLVGLSLVTGDVFVLDDTYAVYTNDAEDNYEGNYYSEAVTREIDWDHPLIYKSALKFRMSGFITSNAEVYIDIYLDGTLVSTYLISGDNENILGPIPNVAVGTIVFGTGVFGGGLPSGTIRKEFVAQFQLNAIRNFLKVQFRIRIDDKLIDFEMLDMLIWAKKESDEFWLPTKIIKPS